MLTIDDCSRLPDFDAGPLLHPLLSRLIRSKHVQLGIDYVEQSAAAKGSAEAAATFSTDQLPQDEGNDVRRFPVAGVKEVRQRVRGKVGQALGAVEGIIDPAWPPPLGLEDVNGMKLLGVDDTRQDAFLGLATGKSVVLLTARVGR